MNKYNTSIKIAVDMMSGDHGVTEFIPAVLSALQNNPKLYVVAVGREEVISPMLTDVSAELRERISIRHASEVVEMDDTPQSALRSKKDSSMRVAINTVKEGVADACVSAGNTGALMATARFVLKMMPGIERPAICTAIPSLSSRGHVHMLDLGANVDTTAQHLYQFAIMGSLLSTAVDRTVEPRVALLNIGEEAMKGNEQIREVVPFLENSLLNYIGFIEGDGIFFSEVDVIVCDGFVGNVALKTMEGTAKVMSQQLRLLFERNLTSKIRGLIAKPVLDGLKAKFDPKKYNGASLLGLRGIVVKSHGNADRVSFENAINISVKLVEQNIIQELETHFAN